MFLFFKLQSDSYAVVDHQAKVFEKREDLWSWLIVLLDGFDYSHITLDWISYFSAHAQKTR
jgi:hypothetical protein